MAPFSLGGCALWPVEDLLSKMRKELLHKYLNDQCTSEELKEVIAWVKSKEWSGTAEQELYSEWKNTDGVVSSQNANERFNRLLDKIHHNINIEHASFVRKMQRKKVLNRITQVAAIAMLPMLAFLLYTFSRHNFEISSLVAMQNDTLEIIAPIGSKTNFVLSDGSQVFLNNGSKLRYPLRFMDNKRDIFLSGEAYFVVAHDEKRPFRVKTRNLNITALGTEFNVFAYPDEISTEATLVEGKVAVEKVLKSGETQFIGEMEPNEQISYNRITDKVYSHHGDIDKYIAWREGKLIFKNESIEEIAHRLSRWYNVDIELTDKRVKQFTYTATFIDETLPQVLELLQIATPISYTIHPRKELPDGTFIKQKVTIGFNERK
ncbi:DUF4974 domain-containing protein [Maribellus luteus]|uniref:DUF4974 domain-containing protein n=1 Tax=Maribellus luteus TaxID=2305463 RepID=A0A399T8M6_9BACT|nr:FecR domain-containing protein [Maribellus luteus]RIJ50521.1 DUF4974 domain-containing protein [Maribellus luteus]